MNPSHVTQAAQAGAKAASKQLSQTAGQGDSLLTVNPSAVTDWKTEQPAREAFAAAAITRYLELQSADVPSVGDCINMIQFTGSINTGSIEAVRTAIVTAYEAKMAKAGNKEMEAYESLCAENQRLNDSLARVRALPEKWLNWRVTQGEARDALRLVARDLKTSAALGEQSPSPATGLLNNNTMTP